MVGKAQLILVLGFALLFMVMGFFWGDISSRSVENQVDYYTKTIAYNIATSGANMALNEIYRDSTWNSGYSDVDYFDGKLNVDITKTGASNEILLITSTGTYMGESHTVKVKLREGFYSSTFAWYIGNSSSKDFITGDTVWGPFHSEASLNIVGDPAFFGKVTTLKGIKPSPAQMLSLGYNPYFSVKPQSGVSVPYPKNYQFVEEKAKALSSGSHFEMTDLWLTFYDDGDVGYRTGSGDDFSTYSGEIRQPLTDFASEGVIYLAKGDIYLSGTLDGQCQVVAGEASGLGNGNVYLVDDIVYKSDPMVRTNKLPPIWEPTDSDDMLSILATNNVRVATSVESGGYINNVVNKDINIHAGIFCAQGGVQLQDYNGINVDCGTFFIKGSVVALKEELIAKLDNNDNVIAGYERYVVFDERFNLTPPNLIKTGIYEIFSWFE